MVAIVEVVENVAVVVEVGEKLGRAVVVMEVVVVEVVVMTVDVKAVVVEMLVEAVGKTEVVKNEFVIFAAGEEIAVAVGIDEAVEPESVKTVVLTTVLVILEVEVKMLFLRFL